MKARTKKARFSIKLNRAFSYSYLIFRAAEAAAIYMVVLVPIKDRRVDPVKPAWSRGGV